MDSALAPQTSRLVKPIAPDDAEPWPPSRELRLVCLDIDDTLIECTAAIRRALCLLLGGDDMWPLWDLITEEHVAMVVAGELEYTSMHHQRTACFLAELGKCVDTAEVADFEHRRVELLAQSWRLFDDVVPCLEWLRAMGVRLAAVTNASGVHQRKKLADLGLAPYFDHIAIAGELGVAKPDPEMFGSVCQAVDCGATQTVHIGDKLDTDAIGAHDAGLGAVWLDRDGAGLTTPAGVHTIGSLAELPELLISEFTTVGVPSLRHSAAPASTS